jgi:ribosome-associated protein
MEADDFISKTRRKQEMHALQELGEELVGLKEDKLGELDLPDSLLSAVREAKHISKHGALRRQLQYIGRLMRDVDAEPIREKLHGWQGQGKENVALQHLAERWRDRLITDEAEFTAFASQFPAADLQHFRALARAARDERARELPPRQYRQLYRDLHALVESGERSAQIDSDINPDIS